jgi:hypothetical protein
MGTFNMSMAEWFGFKIGGVDSAELPDIFPLDVNKDVFIKADVMNIYSKILTDVIERTHGMTEEQTSLLWDNCLASESSEGLITLLARAMTDKQDLFIVYDGSLKVLRKANGIEAENIRRDYKERGESEVGVYVSFRNYTRSDMIKLYSALEYCSVSSLNKSMNLSKTIQFKMNDMRASTGAFDKSEVVEQAKIVAKSMGEGKDVLIDAKDIIETAKPDLTSTKESISFIDQKRSLYLGLPSAYINGIQTGGLGTTGENDTKAIERGLKQYFLSIIKPVVDSLFKIKAQYKSQDFRQVSQGLEALKTFELVTDDLISAENKKKVVDILFDFETKKA